MQRFHPNPRLAGIVFDGERDIVLDTDGKEIIGGSGRGGERMLWLDGRLVPRRIMMYEAFNPGSWSEDGRHSKNVVRLDRDAKNDRIVNLVTMSRAEQVAHNRAPTGAAVVAETEGWKMHPDSRMCHLLFDGKTGDVWAMKSDGTRSLAGGPCGNGGRWLISFGGGITRPRYRFMYEAYHPDECGPDGHISGEEWDIVHIDGNFLNDRIDNLEKVRRSDYARRTIVKALTADRVIGSKSKREEAEEATVDEVVWKEVKQGFEGYHASNQGEIRTPKGCVTFGALNKDLGYMMIDARYVDPVSATSRGVQTLVHRLVCLAFHGPPPTAEHTVDHIDRNKLNNRPENLRWSTKSEQQHNRQHAVVPLELKPLDAAASEPPMRFENIARACDYLQAHVPALAGMTKNAVKLRLRRAADNAAKPPSAKRMRSDRAESLAGILEGFSVAWGAVGGDGGSSATARAAMPAAAAAGVDADSDDEDSESGDA